MAATVLMVGVSGCSSSGKTALARALRDVINGIVLRAAEEQPQQVPPGGAPSEPAEAVQPTVALLHEDDFYLDEARCV
jgi:dephospho-CoA kinase